MESLFSPFRPPQPPPDAREEPAKPLVVEPQTDAHAKPSASLDATPENMSMLNTPDNGAPNGAATTHRGQVAPSASHTTQVAGPTHWTVMCKYTVRACTGNVNPSVEHLNVKSES